MQLIPAIDLRGGRCVRLLKGDFGAETRYPTEPRELLERYLALGARWLHVVDLDGARDGVRANRSAVAALASDARISLQVGGGIRSRESIEELLSDGAQRIVIGSAAVENPDEVSGWLTEFGPERICLAFDVRVESGVPMVQTRGWTKSAHVDLWAAVARYARTGLQHVLCTDIDRDGALSGPAVALYAEATRRFPSVQWQASGGIQAGSDLVTLRETGVAAAVSGKALLEHRITTEELRPFLPNA